MADSETGSDILDRLYDVIESRKGADPDSSWTAKLFAEGVPVIARKLGEESVETLIAAMSDNRKDTVAESADLLYHLLVLWAACGIRPEEVFTELARREGMSGLEEKASR